VNVKSAPKQALHLMAFCHAIAEASPLPMLAVERAEHIVRYVNPAFCDLTGKSKERSIGNAFSRTLQVEDECLLLLDRVYRTGEPETYTSQELSSPHSSCWSYVMWPFLAEDGRPVGIVIQLTESNAPHQQITAMNQALLLGSLRQYELTEAADRLNAQLQAEIIERKNAQEALILSARLATVGTMAATLAHELNNPLESLTNLVYLAAKDPDLSETVRDYLAAAEEELVRIAHMAKQTLGLYRESTDPQPVRMSDLLRNLLSVFNSKIRNKRLQANLEITGEIEILAVPGELRQIFANLLGNSIDAVSLRGTIRIRVSETQQGSIRGVRITIADDGAGIPPANLGKIFQPFFTTKGSLGTGLGLCVSKQIVERYEGSIRIRSCAGPGRTGTVASVFLPVGALHKETKRP
jgi:two-component system NtrC family sensor kinase